MKLDGFTEGSPAEKAGMEPGDIVVKIDGKPVETLSALQRTIRTHQPGDVVDLEVVRFGEHKNFKVKLDRGAERRQSRRVERRPARNGRRADVGRRRGEEARRHGRRR